MFALLQHNPTVNAALENAQAIINAINTQQTDSPLLFITPHLPLMGIDISDVLLLHDFPKKQYDALLYLSENMPAPHALLVVGQTEHELKPLYITHKQCQELCYEHDGTFILEGKKVLLLSYDGILPKKIPYKNCDFVIFSTALPFYRYCQKARETRVSQYAEQHNTPCFFLNQVGATDGYVYNGQSFCVDSEGEVTHRAKAFFEDILINDTAKPRLESFPERSEASFFAITRAIRDQVHKSGLSKVCLGLSGGMDSALVAPLAVEALGKENVIGLLMPSPYSSQHSIDDALLLAENLGIQTYTLPIENNMQAYDALLLPHFKDLEIKYSLSQEQNTTFQNIQSRIRGMLIMAFANKLGAMALGTSNKSEIAVGYSTLYGDTCAGLFPLGDLYKSEVYILGAWYNDYKKQEIIPNACFTKAPSAELSPMQKDEDSLPPYNLLDSFLYQIIDLKNDPLAIEHPFNVEERYKILNLLKKSQFKRQQTAPIVKLTSSTFGKDWSLTIASK